MARTTINVTPQTRTIRFPNGTQVVSIAATGSATQFTSAGHGLRSADLPSEFDTSPLFDRALAASEIYEQETIHLEAIPEPTVRSGGAADDTLVLRPAIPQGDTNPRVVLYEDEAGGVSWHFAEGSLLTAEERDRLARRGLLRDPGSPEFVIPARTFAARDGLQAGMARGALRGFITKIGRKVLKVFVIPFASRVIEKPVQAIAGAAESRVRRNLIWQLTADNYTQGPTDPFTAWSDLDGKPTLLIVHGIFSSAEGMLRHLRRSAMERWISHYQGRVLAFNHLSVTVSPDENARFFLEQARTMLPGGKLNFDILCHSRGGIVSRAMAERKHVLFPGSNCEFNKVYFVASPNNGSALGDGEHLVDMLDVFTNLLTEFPDGQVLYAIETVLGIVKLLAYAAEKNLPGIESMGTKGFIQDVLNKATAGSPAIYGAAGSNYTPRLGVDNGFFNGRFATEVMKRIFERDGQPVANDLVVPRDSVYANNGHPSFPICNPLIYDTDDGVTHSDFFQQDRTIDGIEKHFGIMGVIRFLGGRTLSSDVPPLLDALKAKYQTVLTAAKQLGINLTHLHLQGGKLFIEGTAASEDIKNEIWNAIKAVDEIHSDLTCDLSVDSSLPQPAPDGPSANTYTVQAGDSLWKIAQEQLGNGALFPKIIEANPDRLMSEQSVIHPGDVLNVPDADPGGAGGLEAIQAPSMRGGFRGGPEFRPPTAPPHPSLTTDAVVRKPSIDFHEWMVEGQTFELVVHLSDVTKTAAGNTIALFFATGEEHVRITVELSAPGFTIEGRRSAEMLIDKNPGAPRQSAAFRLTAKNPGPVCVTRTIVASFWEGNNCLGAVSHMTEVVPANYQTANYQGVSRLAGHSKTDPVALRQAQRAEVDLVVFVRETASGVYDIDLQSRVMGEEYGMRPMGELKLAGTEFSNFFAQVIDPRFQTFPSDPKLDDTQFSAALARWSEQFLTQLRSLGRKLWTYMPQAFQHEYVRLMRLPAQPRSICIYSDEMVLPWELVTPVGAIDGVFYEYQPFGVSHVMGRWKPDLGARPQPQTLRVDRMLLLTPAYSQNTLYWAAEEAKELLKRIPSIDRLAKVDRQAVDAVLDGGGVQLLHFNGHGDWNSTADLISLRLENNDTIDALSFTARKLGFTAHPVLYLNACSVGRTGVNTGHPGGFAASCLDGGWSGVIAPYWRVYDPDAMSFCLTLYDKLRLGTSVGEALQEIRRDRPGDFTAQSYAYFGDPWTRLLFPL